MAVIHYIDRISGVKKREKIYGERAIRLLYGNDLMTRLIGTPLLHAAVKWPIISHLYGWWQRQRWTRRKILPFIEAYGIDSTEFLEKPEELHSFDAFFSRKLKPECRPIAPAPAIIPADGRYLVYQTIQKRDRFTVKGTEYSISSLLTEEQLPSYEGGSLVIARLAPPDYHRFHFPVSGKPAPVKLVEGWLYSVNPIALETGLQVYTSNKRMITTIDSRLFGKVVMVEIGATNVGSINQTYINGRDYQKGEEKGFFSFGGSAILLLFEPGAISLSSDLIEASQKGIETLCRMGQPLGKQKK